MHLFMENDFTYFLYKRLESGDTPGLFEGWICVWICLEEAGVPAPAVGGGAGREEGSDQEASSLGGHVTTTRGSG